MSEAPLTASVASLSSVSASFPTLPQPLIDRQHILSALDTMLEDDIQAVVLEGEEGIGKTTLAAHFVQSHPNRAFSLFATGPSALARSPEFLQSDLCDQVAFLLTSTRLPARQDSRAFLRKGLIELARAAVRRRVPYYYVVDGLLEGSDAEVSAACTTLAQLLPLGVKGFKFLITGSAERLSSDLRKGIILKTFTPTGFTLDEARAYLAEFPLDQGLFNDLYKAFRGVPGKLASVRRLLKQGARFSELVDDIPNTLSQLFELEWKAVAQCSPLELDVLGFLAHSQHNLTSDQLNRLCGVNATVLAEMPSRLPFLAWSSSGGVLAFVSASFKSFAMSKMAAHRDTCIQRMIDLLHADKSSLDAVEHLPGYLQAAGRADEIISYLTPDHLASVCERLQSLTPVRAAIECGAHVAEDLKRPVDALRFALQQSLVAELEVASVLASEVDARLEVEGISSALSVANSAFLKEDRLQLLSRIVRHQKRRGEYPDPTLLEEIRQLAASADFSSNPGRAVEIAEDLICNLPDVAMSMVERAASCEPGGGLDLALAKLSIVAADSKELGEKSGASREAIVDRINSVGLRQLARAASLLAGQYSVDELLRTCDAMPSTEDALFLLERWCVDNYRQDDAWRVSEHGLKLILKATTYTPTARVVRRLCSPLPFASEDHPYEVNRILQQVDAQAEILKKRGPAVEYVRLQLHLAEAEATWDVPHATIRIEELFLFADSLTGPTRLEAVARCVRALTLDETNRLHDATSSLLSLFDDELRRSIPELLASTAEHAELVAGVVAALGDIIPTFVHDVISTANTGDRRDSLRHRFATCLIHPKRPLPDVSVITSLLKEFESERNHEACLADLIDRIFVQKDLSLNREWEDLLRRTLSMVYAPLRHEAVAKAYVIARRSDAIQAGDACALLKAECRRSLTRIDSSWTQIDFGFTTAGVLSSVDEEEAGVIYKVTLETRRLTNVPSEPAAIAFIGCLRLAMRAFIGLIRRKSGIDGALPRLRSLLSKVPSTSERARLWGELALRCFSAGADELGRSLAQNDLMAAYSAIPDDGLKRLVLVEITPALFKLHRQVAFDELSKADAETRDEGLAEICSFILTGQPRTEPFDASRKAEFELGYPAAIDILDCLDRMKKDSTSFTVISRLCSSVARDECPLTKEQRSEVARRLEDTARSRFPSPAGVAHEGYRVAADAHIARLRNVSEAAWIALENRAEAIPNVCDRVLVLALVAEAAPSRFREIQIRLLDKARELADLIPCDLDRINRLFNIASIASDVDAMIARQCLRNAFTMSKATEHRTIEEQQRAMVDLAYRIDPAFAKSLVSLLDDDPVRKRARDRLQRHIEVIEARRDVAKDTDAASRLRQLKTKGLVELCWSLLAGLNSGRVRTVKVDSTIPYVRMAGFHNLSETYPVMAWVIENSVQRHDDTPFGKTHLVELFHATAFACDFALRVIGRASGLQQEWSSLGAPSGVAEGLIIHAGEREKAVAHLRNWLLQRQPEYLKICDPYFTLTDLPLLALIQDVVPGCRIQLLISEKKQKEIGVSEPFDDAYRVHWRLHVSDQEPPDADITIVSIAGSGDSPIHDRWIISSGAGLRLGSSFSGFGASKVTEITSLEAETALEREREIDQFLMRQVREVVGKRVKYIAFSLI